ncbi:hypothetical protein TOPH_07024 [Tolypocladium ophioglossoides CBS 100239]|uniref:Rhodopsin domain-containing protein n=1 Tax=Tolypocladium ophioglossoides (strain CBS 100239) TaxID=1163406 RepID=A0A0L0N3H9_TOLOC|nr:hypothetical protein TOPH_07024 [Tolypocladium ophioglossoides CBS 100239]
MSSPAANNVAVTPDDHGAYIVITAFLGVTWTTLVLAIRLYIRFRLNGPFGLDDAAASFATVVGIGQTALTLVAVRNGMGKREDLLESDSIDAVMKDNYVANFLYIVAICSSKCSMSLLIARLTRQTQHLVATHGISGLATTWGIAALFIVGFQCSPPQPWNTADHSLCSTLFTRWAVVEAFSVFIEVLISAMSVLLVWDLSMAFKTKVMVISAFSAQLFVAIPIAFRLVFVHRSMDVPDATFGFTESAIATQVVMHFSVMAATFPCFRQFLQAFDSGLGATTKIATELGTGSQSHSGYVLQSLSTAHDDHHDGNEPREARLRPDSTAQVTTEVSAQPRSYAAGDESRSIESDGSDKAIILRTQQWEIRYEARQGG